jgi:3-deoxy-D-manno-octulosonic-acid transferase
MVRALYSLFWWLALPFVLLRLWIRGRAEPGYRQHIAERLGIYAKIDSKTHVVQTKTIWVHAVSAGETRAAEPLIRALLARYPQHHLLLTHMTPVGRATGEILFSDVAPRLTQSFIPYDIKSFIRRFLRYFSPQICILIETEVWPNLVAECESSHIPVTLVNARLSEKSLAKAMKIPSLFLPAAQAVTAVVAQSEPDAIRLKKLGAKNISVNGNMKFDVAPPDIMAQHGALLREYIGERPVFVCASTRDGEEELLLDAFITLQQPQALLVITPRHPQRFDEVAAMLTARGLNFVRRSTIQFDSTSLTLPPQTQVLLGDSMGEMYMYYAACDLAFIGGSLMPLGGHNLIEACAMGKPVLVGPHTFNFSEITNQAILAETALRATDAEQVMLLAHNLLMKPQFRLNMGKNALAFFQQHQGATARTMQVLEHYM